MLKEWSSVVRKLRRFTLLISPLLLLFLTVRSQVSTLSVSYGFKRDTVAINAGRTFTNLLWIENKSSGPVSLTQVLAAGQKKTGLLRLPDTIRLTPGQKRWFPLKYMADRQTIQKPIQEINVQLQDVERKTTMQQIAAFYARSDDAMGLVIDVEQLDVYLDPMTNQARVMMRCYNNGLIPVSFRLELTEIPEGLEFITEKSNLTLEPGAQESLPFIARKKNNNRAAADFAVTIRALDVTGNLITSKRLRIMSVSSDRRLSLIQSPFGQDKPNTVSMRYMNSNNSLSSYQIQGNGSYNMGEEKELKYRLNTDYFNNPGQSGLNISDSYLEYQSKTMGLKVGSIYENIDFNLNGRGLKGTLKLGDKQCLNMYALDRNYLIYSDFLNQNLGNTFALSYQKDAETANKSKSLILLQDDNFLTDVKTTLLSGLSNFELGDKQHLGLEGGYGIQRFSGVADAKQGAALGINYNLNLEKFNLFSNNYYSTPYYGGLRSGALQLENQLMYRLGKNDNLSLHFSLMDSKPRVAGISSTNLLNLTGNYGNTNYGLGYGTKLKNWSATISPYYFYQHMLVLNSGNWQSASLRTKVSLSYSNSFQQFSIDADNGYTYKNTSANPPAPFFSSRINASYRNKFAGFTAYAQYNSYYLSDALAMPGNAKYYTYSFGPNARFALFKERLSVDGNLMYSYFGFNNTQNYALNNTLKWRLKGNWALSSDIYYGLSKQSVDNQYNPATGLQSLMPSGIQQQISQKFSNRQIRFGLEKQFGSTGQGGLKKLELVYFEDRNGNGYRDENEPYAPGIMVKINDLAAITNAKGMVRFSGEKDQTYSVSIVNNKDWNITQETDVFLNKNIRLEIPLIKRERLTGKLTYIPDKYSDDVPSSAGLRVNAVAQNGKVYSTITNDEGTFNFYLPENKYSISVESEGMPYALLNPKEDVEVKRNKVVSLEFKYRYERRKIEVTRFK
jgi:hypothetical protein